MRKTTLSEFKAKAIKIHGEKYDYSLVDYINKRTKVKIVCPEHGIFEQTPDSHLNQSNGCKKCAGNEKITFDIFVKKAKIKHDSKYNYENNTNFDNNEHVNIICKKKHGLFKQKAYSHLSGKGCNKCAIEDRTDTDKTYVEKKLTKFTIINIHI